MLGSSNNDYVIKNNDYVNEKLINLNLWYVPHI